MNKIKIFRFEVSNSVFLGGDEKEIWYKEVKKRLVDEKTIEKIINDFIENKTVVDIKVNTIDVNYHNNGRCNTIHLIYNVIYSE